MNNRGELTDVMIFMITVFILAVGLFILMFIVPTISNGLRNAGLNNSAEGINAINSMDYFSTHTINNGYLMLFVGLLISVMITSFMVRTHPIFLFLYILFLGVSILLAFYLGNIYHDLTANPIFSNMVNTATYSNLIMSHIAEITLAVGALSMIIVFAKFSTYGGTQPF